MSCACGFRLKLKRSNAFFVPETTIYMDYNATTPVDKRTLGAFDKICRREWGNPSSLHSSGIQIGAEIDKCRKNILDYFNLKSGNVYFCSNGSESIHAAIWGILSKGKTGIPVSTLIEHPAVKKPLRYYRFLKNKTDFLRVDKNGAIILDELDRTLKTNGNSFLIYSPVNHETGAIQPVEEIYKIAKKYDTLILLDSVQAAPRLPVDKWSKFCDMFSVSGHKIYSPKGIAALYAKENVKLKPFRLGGCQEDGIFPGTENAPGIAAFNEAINLLRSEFVEESKFLKILIEEGAKIFDNSKFDFVIESPENRAPGVLCVSFPWIKDMEKFMYELNESNICLSRFSACAGRVTGASPVLPYMGVPSSRSATSIRISCGRWSKREDFYNLAKFIEKYYENLNK
ncbi:MAG: Cysteine desulfurase [Spirochaetes bacterium ADurb.Bin133]|nr:MAG: Cysteine desulfurase [Spirochaetes bacterium ADurb.Bin133]